MSTSRIIPGSQYFADPAVGRPVANGNVYIGAPNTDPFILANRVTVDLIKQDGSTVSIPPASQPIHTTAGGLLAYAGSAVQATYSGGAYSISLRNSADALLDYFPSVSNTVSPDAPTLQADNFYTNDASSASNAYVLIPPVSPGPDSLLDGQEITFRPSDNGSGPATINVIGNAGPIGAYPWVLADGTNDLPNDYVKTTRDYKVRWKASTSRFIDMDLGLFSYNPSIQAWNTHIDYYKVPSYVTGSDTLLYKSLSQTGPNLGGSHDPVGDAGVHWTLISENKQGNYAGVVSITTTPYTLLAANIGKLHTCTASAAVVNMVAIASVGVGELFAVVNYLNTNITINRDGASTFAGVNGSTTVITLPPYSAVTIVKGAAGVWDVTGFFGNQQQSVLVAGAMTAVASLPFVLSTLDPVQSVYNRYKLHIFGFQPTDDDKQLYATISSDAGATYAATNYGYSIAGADSSGASSNDGSTYADTKGKLAGGSGALDALSNAAGETAVIEINLANMNTGTSLTPLIRCDQGYPDANSQPTVQHSFCSNSTAADYDAIKLTWESAGNFAAVGYYVLYKLAQPF